MLFYDFESNFANGGKKGTAIILTSACSFGWWLVLICSERTILLAGG
jgi:hypothetical protein